MGALLVLLSVALASVPALPSANSGVPAAEPSRATPRAGRMFVGAYAGFPQPDYIRVLSVGCRVRLWNRRHTAARQLKPIIRYYRTKNGHIRRVTCGWHIPTAAAGQQLELPRPSCLDCPFDRYPFIVVYTDRRDPPGFGRSAVIVQGVRWRIRA
jgi:hypothetical protein